MPASLAHYSGEPYTRARTRPTRKRSAPGLDARGRRSDAPCHADPSRHETGRRSRLVHPAADHPRETYALPRDLKRDAALVWFHAPGNRAFVADESGRVLGCCFYRANKDGGGGHVANAAYATHPEAQGRGVASAMCAHSLDAARAEGFRAMQFNFVIASNPAVRLWQRHGFEIVGTLPGAFDHPTLGEVDAHVMYRRL